MRYWSSDVCSSDLSRRTGEAPASDTPAPSSKGQPDRTDIQAASGRTGNRAASKPCWRRTRIPCGIASGPAASVHTADERQPLFLAIPLECRLIQFARQNIDAMHDRAALPRSLALAYLRRDPQVQRSPAAVAATVQPPEQPFPALTFALYHPPGCA